MKQRKKVRELAITVHGRPELVCHIRGKKLTNRVTILAECNDCMGGYVDGKRSCRMPKCPLYPFMPYKNIV